MITEFKALAKVRHAGPVYRIVQGGAVTRSGLHDGERPLVLSYGAGVDSFWTLVMILTSPMPYFTNLRRRLTLIIHSDLGAEWPETTWHLHHVAIPLAREHGYDMTVIRPRQTARDGTVHENITDFYMAQAAIPTKAKRSCTPRFKIGPLLAASRDLLGTDDYETIICYDASETRRTDRLREVPDKERERIRGRLHHPPMMMGRYRADLMQEIIELGYPVPPKSACFWCIYSRIGDIHLLHDMHPELLDQAIALEENMQTVRGRPDISILHKPLRSIRKRYRAQKAAAAMGLVLKRGQLEMDLARQAAD